MRTQYRTVVICMGAALLLSASARADNSANRQARAIVDSWFASGPMETTVGKAPAAVAPAIERGRYPLIQPRVTGQKRIYSKLPSIPHLFYRDVRGPATLAVTEHGPAVRYYKGYLSKRVDFNMRVVKETQAVRYSKLKPLAPRWLPKKLGMRLARWRAQRLVRKAIQSGRASAPAMTGALARSR
jgi:hypothetical protein